MSSFLEAVHAQSSQDGTPEYRPVLHYTAQNTWLNDPNGLVFHGGLFHLYYQNNPFGNVWGNMSWGHATSSDLLRWDEQQIAIACDDQEEIFSGSIVVDHGNTSGFGTGENPPLVAIYTSAFKEASAHRGTQAQSLAFSLDGGMTWSKYGGNPVLTRGSANFRDPKVFRHEGSAGPCWVLAAVEAQRQQVVLYRSENLKDWEFLSTFGPANAVGGEWECPDLFPLALNGDPDNVLWVMVVNINPGAVAGGSGSQYFIGDFDGIRFTPLPSSLVDVKEVPGGCLWLDWGPDYYAAVSFSNVPQNRRIMIGWMNNWDYANSLPTAPWRSGMSLAREVTLATIDGQPRLRQQPILPTGAAESVWSTEQLELREAILKLPDCVPGAALLIDAEILPGISGTVGFRLLGAAAGGQKTTLCFDASTSLLTLDRRSSGNTAFHEKFASSSSAPIQLDDGVLRLRIVVDHCSVEVFAQDGAEVLTGLVFPGPGGLTNELSADGRASTICKLTVQSFR